MRVSTPENIAEQHDLGHTIIIKRKDGIIEVRCADVVIYTPEKVKENHACIEKFANGKKAIVLTITGHYTHASSEARAFTASGPHKNFVAAEAFLIRSFGQWMVAALFTTINRPIVPAKVFRITQQPKAEQWLRKQKV